MKRIPIIIDTDPGGDDALAILMALQHKKEFDIKLVTTVEGNVSLEKATKNALFILNKFSKEKIPVAKGLKSKDSHNADAEDVYGKQGLGNAIVLPSETKVIEKNAVDAMYETICNFEKKIVLVCLGPLTNIAQLLKIHPDVACKIKDVVSMIASEDGKGNISPYAEFNAYFDFPSLEYILKSDLKMTIVSMSLGLLMPIKKSMFLKHKKETEKQKFIYDLIDGITDTLIEDCMVPYDVLAIYGLLFPKEFIIKKCDVLINVDENKQGQTIIVPNESGKFLLQWVKNPRRTRKHLFKEIYKEK